MNGRPIWPFALLLVVWGNAVALALGPTARLPGGSWAFVVAGVALIVTSLVAARTYGLRPADLGLGPELGRALRGAVIGAVTSAIAILLAVAAIRLAPIALGRSIAYEPVGVVTPEELARHLAFFLPIGAAEHAVFTSSVLPTEKSRVSASLQAWPYEGNSGLTSRCRRSAAMAQDGLTAQAEIAPLKEPRQRP